MKINSSYPNLSIYKYKTQPSNIISPLAAPYAINNDIAFTCRTPKVLYHITTESNYYKNINKVGLLLRKDRLFEEINAVFTFDSLSQVKHWHLQENNFALQVLAKIATKLSSIKDKFVLLEIKVDSDILENLRVRNVNDAQQGVNLQGFPVTDCPNIKDLGKGVEYFSLAPIPADKIELVNSATLNDFLETMNENNKSGSQIAQRFIAKLMKKKPNQKVVA